MNTKPRVTHIITSFAILSLVGLLTVFLIHGQTVTASPAVQSVADAAALTVTGTYAGSVTVDEVAPAVATPADGGSVCLPVVTK